MWLILTLVTMINFRVSDQRSFPILVIWGRGSRIHHDHWFSDMPCNLLGMEKKSAPQIISLRERSLPRKHVQKKTTAPYFLWRFKNVEEVEEKVPSVGEMFCSWIIILRHDGIEYNITDDITWVGDSLTTENQFPMCHTSPILSSTFEKILRLNEKSLSYEIAMETF